MKLELKHLAPYLPYGLKYIDNIGAVILMKSISTEINLINMGWGDAKELTEIKPILHPLSDLTKDEEFEQFCKGQIICAAIMITNSNSLIKVEVLGGVDELIAIGNEIASECSYLFYVWLIEHHYDINGLIEKGLAIDINTLK